MERRRREVRHVQAISVRFEVEDKELLDEIAKRTGIPPAILVRNWAKEHLDQARSDETRAHEGTPRE